MRKIGASLMCTNLMNVERDIKELDEAGIDFYHIDVMDGQFVNNFALSPDFVKQLKTITNTDIDVHIMAENCERFIDMFADAGADMISIHVESTNHLQAALSKIKERGLKAGVVLNPATPLNVLDYVLDLIDYVCIMTVNPGFAGQKFIPTMYEKIKAVNEIIQKSSYDIKIEVDGNIGEHTILQCMANGASLFVGGTSAIYKKTGTLAQNVAIVKELIK